MRRNNAVKVFEYVENDPGTSTRRISVLNKQTKMTLQDTLRLYSYHTNEYKVPVPSSYWSSPKSSSSWMMEQLSWYFSRTLFCSKATFTRDGINNFRNVWAVENPHGVRETHFHKRSFVNVWTEIINPSNGNFNTEIYRAFLKNDLPLLLEEIPLQIRRIMFFLHDGAPVHYGRGPSI